jgi:hypothetical protein
MGIDKIRVQQRSRKRVLYRRRKDYFFYLFIAAINSKINAAENGIK